MVEDSEDDALLVQNALKAGVSDLKTERVQTAEAMAWALKNAEWDVVLSDFSMPSFGALEALGVLKDSKKDLPFIIVSGTVGEDVAVKMMKAGAHDYLMKDNLLRLVPAIHRAFHEASERRKRREAEAELKDKEAQLLQSQKLEVVGSLAGGIAHDFNNLLGAILLYCDSAVENLRDPVAAEKDISGIRATAEHAALLTRQLLTFSRKHAHEPTVTQMNSIVKDIQRILHRMIGAHILLDFQLSEFTETIRVDRAQFGQVILNLVVNSRDAMPKGGALIVKTRLENVRVERKSEPEPVPPGIYSVLSVQDHGQGMSRETRAQIFEPFFTTKGPGKGTGLGLSTVWTIVKQHQGYLTVKSELGVGTEFEIYFPVVGGTQTVPEPPEGPVSLQQGAGKTVLLVEDRVDLRMATTAVLARAGYVVFEVTGVEEALTLLLTEKRHVDLVISDLVTQQMDGVEFERQVSKHRKDLKWLFVSGFSDRTPEGFAFLPKPFSQAELLAKVQSVIAT